MNRPLRYLTCAFVVALIACGGDDPAAPDDSNVILNTTVTLTGGTTCANGGVNEDFTSQAGKAVTITASGSTVHAPQMTLYAPDFATQLAGSSPNGAGKAKLTFTLTETGVHHVTICDVNGLAGSLTVVVTAQ